MASAFGSFGRFVKAGKHGICCRLSICGFWWCWARDWQFPTSGAWSAKKRKRGAFGVTAARVALVMVVLYAGGRMILHSRATELLRSRDYRGEAPQNVGAFAASSNPFLWRGLVSTSAAIDELKISLLPGAGFDPEHAVPHYKPEESAAIAAAQNTADGKLF